MKNQKLNNGPILICTGGGDAPGLNSALRAAAHRVVLGYGGKLFGIYNGLNGLFAKTPEYEEIQLEQVAAVHTYGGTIIGAASQGSPLREAAEAKKAMGHFKKNWEKLSPRGLIVIGGEGTHGMAAKIASCGYPLVGMPKTIDNDLVGSDVAIGFSTAVEVASYAAKSLIHTAAAHQRLMVLEVMGRNSGFLALHAGIASGVDGVLIPEIPFSMDQIESELKKKLKLQNRYKRNLGGRPGLQGMVMIVAEGAVLREASGGKVSTRLTASGQRVLGGVGDFVAKELSQRLGIEARVNTLGHVQRGADPNAADRILATQLAVEAVDVLYRSESGFVLTTGSEGFKRIPYHEIGELRRKILPNDPLLATAKGVGIILGGS